MTLLQSIQAAVDQENERLAHELHLESRLTTFDETAGAINDVLVKILGTCDAKAPDLMPEIKNHIGVINERLKEARNYYAEHGQRGVLDINMVCAHVVNSIQDHFINHRPIRLERDFGNIKMLAMGDLVQLEHFLLYALISLINANGDPVDITLITRQKDHHIMVILRKQNHNFTSEELESLQKKSTYYLPEQVRIEPFDLGLELTIKLPLKFETHHVTISEPKMKTRIKTITARL